MPLEPSPNANRLKQSRRWLAVCLGGLLAGTAGESAAQNNFAPRSGQVSSQQLTWQQNGLQPVPKVRSSAITSGRSQANSKSNTDALRRPGWNLRWRKSPAVATDEKRQLSDQAFAAASQSNGDSEQVASRAHGQMNPEIQPTSWLTQPASHDGSTDHSNEGKQIRLVQGGGFDLPDLSGAGDVSPPDPSVLQRLPNQTLPDQAAPSQPPVVNPFRDDSAGVPRPSLPNNGSPSGQLETLPPGEPLPDLEDMFHGDEPLPAPNAESAPTDDGSSIRDMLEDAPEPQANRDSKAADSDGTTPDGLADDADSPSDREMFDTNPFGQRDATEDEGMSLDRDRRDRDRLRRESDDRPSIFDEEDESEINSGTGMSCDDFRNRIAAETIDRVSLDISPPFRPDVIDESEFGKLKGRFDGKQQVREWRSIDGRPLGTGRLSDLAYEKAVIQTAYGTQEELPLNRLSEADLAFISENWGLPTECLIEQVSYTPRNWTPTTMTYAASNLCHKPLYFEEVNLERYGHTAGPLAQPIISSAHFFLNIAVLPYKMGVHSPHECQYALGYYRPGNCAPWIVPPVPLSVKGAWYQAAAVTGTALLVP